MFWLQLALSHLHIKELSLQECYILVLRFSFFQMVFWVGANTQCNLRLPIPYSILEEDVSYFGMAYRVHKI
jgi:hypothetical protein